MSIRWAVLALLAATLGCQCLEPVEELAADGGARDGGADGSVDGGLDAGPECSRHSDCELEDAGTLPFCFSLSPSCLAGRCVLECNGSSRTCEVVDGGECLRCSDPPDEHCSPCLRARVCTMQVSSDGCPGRFRKGGTFSILASTGYACGVDIAPADGGTVAGRWFDLPAGGIASIPELGGWCTAQSLYTAVPRLSLHCPECTFVAVGCE